MNDSTDDVEARIRALGHVRVSVGAHNATQALTSVLEDPQVRAGSDPAHHRRVGGLGRRHRIVIGSLIALAGLGIGVPAIATSILARTGEFGDPSTSTEEDGSEWIDVGAEDAPQVVIDAYPEYLTLPLGIPKEAAIADVSRWFQKVAGGARPGESLLQEGIITDTYEDFGMCAWTDVWLSARESGDTADQALATAWISDLNNYRNILSTADPSLVDRVKVVAAAATANEPRLLEESYAEKDCAGRMERLKE
jgi:hypothetical protein